jgi:hypothetical protein
MTERKAGKKIFWKVCIVVIVLLAFGSLFFVPLSSSGQPAKIKDVLITRDAERITVYAMVSDCFTHDMEAAILAGVPTVFTFIINLYEKRTYWFDANLSHVEINHTLKYDNIKKVFTVYDDDQKSTVFSDLESAKRAMAELNGVPVAAIASLSKGKTYYLKMKAKLDKVRLPMRLEYLLFFVSLWDFETDWIEKSLPVDYDKQS